MYNDIKQSNPRLRPIPEFQDYYVNEELGDIWSFKMSAPKILKPGLSKGGQSIYVVLIGDDFNRYTRAVKRLVLNVTNPMIGVVTLDRNPWNVRKNNLEAMAIGRGRSNLRKGAGGFKGVHKFSNTSYQVRVWRHGGDKYPYLGSYDNIYEAAAVANIAISKYYGHLGVYNKVDGLILTL